MKSHPNVVSWIKAPTVLSRAALALLCLFVAPVATVAQGLLYVTEAHNNQIVTITSTGTRSVFASGLNDPEGITFDASGNLYEADWNGHTLGAGSINKFSPAGVKTTIATGINPVCLVFDSSGNLFATDSGTGEIDKYTPAGVRSVFASGVGVPAGLVKDGAGNLLAADFSTGHIYKFTPAGVKTTFATISSAFGLALDSAGDVFVSTGNSVSEFTPSGTGPTVFASGLNSAEGLAFDSAGNLFVGNAGDGKIYEVTPGGTKSLYYDFGSTSFTPRFLAFEPVPEPSTWLLIVAGSGLLFAFRRRRE